MTRGLALVEQGKTAEALAAAEELRSIRYSGAFEIEAQALAREGSKEEAIAVLRKGLEAAPTSWLNGNLLGNYLSDLGRYEEAFAAYEQALREPSADRVLIEANYALALLRAGRDADARARIATVPAHDLSKAEPDTRVFFESVLADLPS
ncbi:tetratricopeptide repeat protein [Phenylobacterium sp.]|uniref:tetratricopeptide repeat protein n=1 Tax=Phenylobacterium sp. TaxID=1871053 RepID=UPI002CC5BC50|nr:tetratricopeptide repeat protein [Phenylobacterium sp.]HVI34322.1 tetratricopeptide repeat protein [Phenylobacterium sp.]